jgi:hypothetical protein
MVEAKFKQAWGFIWMEEGKERGIFGIMKFIIISNKIIQLYS